MLRGLQRGVNTRRKRLSCSVSLARLLFVPSRLMNSQEQIAPFMEPIHILGGGSIGLLFAASIRSAFPSYPLSVLLRERHETKIENDKIMVCLMKYGQPKIIPVPAQVIGSPRQRPITTLLVVTKAFVATEAVLSILPRLHPQKVSVIVLCNGALSVREELKEMLANKNMKLPENMDIVLAATTHGAYRDDGGHDDEIYRVVHAGEGKTFIEEQPSISQLWDQSWLDSKSITSKEMNILLWQKLAANCAINPLTALLKCENGRLLQPVGQGYPSMDNIIREVSDVAVAAARLDGNVDVSFLSFDSLRNFVDRVIQDTQHNRSSMLQDVLNNRRTEVMYLNGYIAEKGKKTGVETPINEGLYRRINQLSNISPKHMS